LDSSGEWDLTRSGFVAGDRKVIHDITGVSMDARFVASTMHIDGREVFVVWDVERGEELCRLPTEPLRDDSAPMARKEIAERLRTLRRFRLPQCFFSDDGQWVYFATGHEEGVAWPIVDPPMDPVEWTVHMGRETERLSVPVVWRGRSANIDFEFDPENRGLAIFDAPRESDWRLLFLGGKRRMFGVRDRYRAAHHVLVWRDGDEESIAFAAIPHKLAYTHFVDTPRFCAFHKDGFSIFDPVERVEVARLNPRRGRFTSIISLPGDHHRWALVDLNEIIIVRYQPAEENSN